MDSYDHKRFLKLYENQVHQKQKRYSLSYRVLWPFLISPVIVKELDRAKLKISNAPQRCSTTKEFMLFPASDGFQISSNILI